MSSENKPLRLFVAVRVPDAELERVEAATSGLRGLFPKARWAPVENQHVTLKFLGTTEVEGLDPVIGAIDRVTRSHAASQVSLEGLGVFPGPRRVRVLWAGLVDESRLLTALAEDIAEALVPLGYEKEKRGFTPHLTLARFREPVRIEELPTLPRGEAFRVEGVHLFRSKLSPKGARYELLHTSVLHKG